MGYKTVRRNGRDVLINTTTGKEVGPGQRIANELRWVGKGITDNLTYSDKVDRRSGRRLTPAEVRKAEAKKPAKPKAPTDAQLRKEGYQIGDGLPSGRNNQGKAPQAKPQAPRTSSGSGSTRSTRTSGGGGGSTRTYASTMPAVVTRTVDAPAPSRQTGDKQKDMATWAQSNKKLGEALGKRNAERGTSRSTNPLMRDLVGGMKKREDTQDQQNGTGKYLGPASPGKSANNSPSAANKFNTTDSLYTPKSKLDDDKERRRRAMELKNNFGRYTG
jgi:hypothetical protein